jgi:RNA polymerase sigma-70 factor, ECF subfamily
MTAETEGRFESILRETEPRIRAYIAGLGVAPDRVDDLAQDAFVEFYLGMGAMPEGMEPIRWLKGIARKLCFSHFREEKRASGRHRAALAEILDRTRGPLESSAGGGRVAEILAGCLEKLGERPRRLLMLCYGEGHTSEAIARTLSMTAEAVRIALFRIRAALRNCVEKAERQGAS